MSSKRVSVRQRILQIWSEHSQKSLNLIAKEANATQWTVKRTIDRCQRQRKINFFAKIWPQSSCLASNLPMWQEKQDFFVESSTNTDFCVRKCLQARLLSFLRAHPGSTFFWPDLATLHYSQLAKNWFAQIRVQYPDNENNPSNLPELRLVERYWVLVKGRRKMRQKF